MKMEGYMQENLRPASAYELKREIEMKNLEHLANANSKKARAEDILNEMFSTVNGRPLFEVGKVEKYTRQKFLEVCLGIKWPPAEGERFTLAEFGQMAPAREQWENGVCLGCSCPDGNDLLVKLARKKLDKNGIQTKDFELDSETLAVKFFVSNPNGSLQVYFRHGKIIAIAGGQVKGEVLELKESIDPILSRMPVEESFYIVVPENVRLYRNWFTEHYSSFEGDFQRLKIRYANIRENME